MSRFQEKYGERPIACHVNPLTLNGVTAMPGIEIVPDEYVLPDHVLVRR